MLKIAEFRHCVENFSLRYSGMTLVGAVSCVQLCRLMAVHVLLLPCIEAQGPILVGPDDSDELFLRMNP